MIQTPPYSVSARVAAPRMVAAVRARLPVSRVSHVFRSYLDQVYATARRAGIQLDGQNIFLYEPISGVEGEVNVTFGVGVLTPFSPIDGVKCVPLPTGEVATSTHSGDYAGLGEAHAAVIEWCRANGRALTGVRWEVYGHWRDDEPPRTEVYYLLSNAPRGA